MNPTPATSLHFSTIRLLISRMLDKVSPAYIVRAIVLETRARAMRGTPSDATARGTLELLKLQDALATAADEFYRASFLAADREIAAHEARKEVDA
jgi:hypothetical protein